MYASSRLLMATGLVLLPFSAHTQPTTWPHTLDSAMSVVANDGLFDGQILIVEGPKTVFHAAYGEWGDAAITPNTPLPVASLTKAFTAAMVLALVDEGVLQLEDSLRHFIPQLPYPKVTLHHLLSMTSGLPRFFNTISQVAPHDRVISNPEIIEMIAQHQPEAAPSGEKFQYNNTNYLLLATVAELATGKSYAALMDHYVLEPLELKNSSVSTPKAHQPITSDNYYQPYGEGNLHTTAYNLHAFVQALRQGNLLSSELREKAWSGTLLSSGNPSPYGYAWLVSEEEGETKLSLRGDDEGLFAELAYWPNSDRLMVYLHVSTGANAGAIQEMVKAIWAQQPYTVPQARPQVAVPITVLKKYVGQYELPNFGLIHITLEEGSLYLRPNAIPGKEKLVPATNRRFYFEHQDLAWEFYLDDQGEVLGFGMAGQPENMGTKK